MKSILLLSWVLLGPVFWVSSENNEAYLSYIEEYKDIAISEMERTGVPASIKLAQGLLESRAGLSELARKGNNHFGIKCGSYWEENFKDQCIYREDDEYDERGKKKKSCFRKYDDPIECFIAHSDFLRDHRKAHRYGRLFELDPKDYVGWAHGLRAAGYATDPQYPNKLITVIETYHLYKYDYKALAKDEIELVDTDDPVKEEKKRPLRVVMVNSIDAVYARNGDTPWYIAEETETSIDQLMKYNEHLDSKVSELDKGTLVFLQKKRKRYFGRRNYHYVKEGDRMIDIATEYAIDLGSLYKRNRMPEGKEPLPGEKIYLRKKRDKDDPPRYTDPEELNNPVKTEEKTEEEVDIDESPELITRKTYDPATGKWSDSEQTVAVETQNEEDNSVVSTRRTYNPETGEWGEIPQDETNGQPEAETGITTEDSNELLADKLQNTGEFDENATHLDFALAVGEVIEGPLGEDPRDVNRVLRLAPQSESDSTTKNAGQKDQAAEVMTFDIVMQPEDSASGQVNINQSPTAQYYEVKKGDTLFSIYRQTGTPVAEIRQLNGLPSNVIHPGDVLRVK